LGSLQRESEWECVGRRRSKRRITIRKRITRKKKIKSKIGIVFGQ